MAVCASCGTEEEGRFCGACGARMPEKAKPRELSRPRFGPFAMRVSGTIAAGSQVTVAPSESFYGMRFGTCHVTLAEGTHTIDDELDAGWFIANDGVDLAFDDDLGILEDNHGQRGGITISGTVRVRIDEPRDFVSSNNHDDLDIAALSQRVRAKVRDLIDGEVRNLLAKDRYLTSMQSSKAVDSIKTEVHSAWTADGERDAFVAIDLTKLVVRTATLARTSEPEVPVIPDEVLAQEPATMADLPTSALKFLDGQRVDVVWSDGQRYPATVRTSGCLVRFDDGQEHWIPIDSLAVRNES